MSVIAPVASEAWTRGLQPVICVELVERFHQSQFDDGFSGILIRSVAPKGTLSIMLALRNSEDVIT